MQTPDSSSSFFKPEEAYAAAAERFFELMKSFGMSAGKSTDWTALATPLAAQFERWLQMSQSAAPWLMGMTGASSGGSASAATGPAAFGPLPLGPAAVQGAEVPRSLQLLGRLAQLQGELGKYWSEIAATAAQRFIARLGAAPSPPATPQQALKLYELWVNCAEEAYAATVHKEGYARVQAELANTSAALLGEQRQQAEALVRAFGLPTRNEVDALYTQLKELRQELAQLARTAHGPAAPAHSGATPQPARVADTAAARRPASRSKGKRPTRAAKGKRARGPRR